MRAVLIAVALLSASAAVFFACSDDTPATPGGSDGGSETGSSPSDGGQEPIDGGPDVLVSPTGCPLKTTDYRAGSKAESRPRTDIAGGVDWANVEGALSEDGKFATVSLNDGQESAELRVSQFGVQLPPNAETWGIEVQLKRRAPDGGVEDVRMDIEIPGKAEGARPNNWKFVKGDWPTKIVGTHHYGQAIDTWGVDLYPADVATDGFAAKLWVKKKPDAGTGPVFAIVDSIKVAVWYCLK